MLDISVRKKNRNFIAVLNTNLPPERYMVAEIFKKHCIMNISLCIYGSLLIALYTFNFTHCSMHIVLCTLDYEHCTLHHCTMHITLSTLH